MNCLDCDYQLDGLEQARCPECGRAFDPDDEETFASYGRSSPLFWTAVVILCFPVIAIGLMLASWLAAWATLGHPPRAWIDDPKEISPLVTSLSGYAVDACGWMGMYMLAAPVVAAGYWAIDKRRNRHRNMWWLLCLSGALIVLFVVVALWLNKWLMD